MSCNIRPPVSAFLGTTPLIVTIGIFLLSWDKKTENDEKNQKYWPQVFPGGGGRAETRRESTLTESLPLSDLPPLADVHCHLGENLARELHLAKGGSVRAVVLTAARAEEFGEIASFCAADTRPRLIPAFGVHPWYALSAPENIEELLDRMFDAVSGGALLGEIGLDFARPKEEHTAQRALFRRQLAYAARRKAAAVIHSVRSAEEVIAEVKKPRPRPVFLLHSPRASADQVRRLAELGGYFSFSAHALAPPRKRMRAAAAAVPDDRLLIESDWPSGGDSPADIADALIPLAELRGIPAGELARRVWENSRRFFAAAGVS